MRLFARLSNLVRGLVGRWIGEREHRNPGAVYEAAIQERVKQYATLREAAAGVIYMRQKLERELGQRTAELARVKRELDVAVERDFLLQALKRHGGNITKAAEDIGMYRQNFQQKMRELGITAEDAVG